MTSSESVPRRSPAPSPGPGEPLTEWRLPDTGESDPRAWEARIRGLVAAAYDFATDARRVGISEHGRAEEERRTAHARAAHSSADARQKVEHAVADAVDAAASVAGDRVEDLAPGLASLDPAAAAWESREFLGAYTPLYLRIGTVDARTAVPAVVPLLGTAGWCVQADDAAAARQLLQNVLLRLMAGAEPLAVRVDAYDPRLTGALGVLGDLTAKAPRVVPPASHSTDDLHAMLAELVETASRRSAKLTQPGHRTFEEMVDQSGQVGEPYRVVVLLDYPAGVDARAQQDLVRLAGAAASRGICFLVHHDPGAGVHDDPGVRDVDPSGLTTLLEDVVVRRDRVEVSWLPGVPVRGDPPFDPGLYATVCGEIADLIDRAALPTLDFADTLPDRDDWWQPIREELSTVIGMDNRTPATLRLRSGNPSLPHVLIGGAVGQGKSNLLLVLIHGLAARYSPDDLEMYLLDFKQGLEFSVLGPGAGREHWLPHA
ncbi:MAG: cell division protein FtsK, partial [Propionibacteriales bacterium]|nr:cell division protein FtsK [Propionibacteriales bacterium]